MDRKQTTDTLSIVGEALAFVSIVPAMQYLWFNGDGVFAFDDTIAIGARLKTGISAGIAGRPLLDVLANSKAKDITIEPQDDAIKLKLAKTTATFKTLNIEDAPFEMPRFEGASLAVDSDDFLHLLEVCMLSAGGETMVPSQYHFSVVLFFDGLQIIGFATNDASISRSMVKMKKQTTIPGPLVLPASFCAQLLKIASKKGKFELRVDQKKHVMAKFDDVLLSSRILPNDELPPFQSMFNRMVTQKRQDDLVEIPARLFPAIARASINLGRWVGKEFQSTRFTVRDSKLVLMTEHAAVSIRDAVMLDGEHPDTSADFEIKFLKRAIEHMDRMTITKELIILNADSDYYLLSAVKQS